jgi:transcriptional regulator with XRE-family HTH domain
MTLRAMGVRHSAQHVGAMRLWYNHIWKSRAYRHASLWDRRLIEIRFCLARALKARRRELRVTQAELAARLHVSRAAISRVERASNRVSLDMGVRALIALDCTDAAIANVFDAGNNEGIRLVRRRAEQRGFPKALPPGEPSPVGDHRFFRQRPRRRRLPDVDDDADYIQGSSAVGP